MSTMQQTQQQRPAPASREPVAVSPDLGFVPAIYIPVRIGKAGRAASGQGLTRKGKRRG
jgi:hypothetical protein